MEKITSNFTFDELYNVINNLDILIPMINGIKTTNEINYMFKDLYDKILKQLNIDITQGVDYKLDYNVTLLNKIQYSELVKRDNIKASFPFLNDLLIFKQQIKFIETNGLENYNVVIIKFAFPTAIAILMNEKSLTSGFLKFDEFFKGLVINRYSLRDKLTKEKYIIVKTILNSFYIAMLRTYFKHLSSMNLSPEESSIIQPYYDLAKKLADNSIIANVDTFAINKDKMSKNKIQELVEFHGFNCEII